MHERKRSSHDCECSESSPPQSTTKPPRKSRKRRLNGGVGFGFGFSATPPGSQLSAASESQHIEQSVMPEAYPLRVAGNERSTTALAVRRKLLEHKEKTSTELVKEVVTSVKELLASYPTLIDTVKSSMRSLLEEANALNVKPPANMRPQQRVVSPEELAVCFSAATNPSEQLVELCRRWNISPIRTVNSNNSDSSSSSGDRFPVPLPDQGEVTSLGNKFKQLANSIMDSNYVHDSTLPPLHVIHIYASLAQTYVAALNGSAIYTGESQFRESVSTRVINLAFEYFHRPNLFRLSGLTAVPIPTNYTEKFFPDTTISCNKLHEPILLVETKPVEYSSIFDHPDLHKLLVMMALSLDRRFQDWKCSREGRSNPLLSSIFGLLVDQQRCRLFTMRIKIRGADIECHQLYPVHEFMFKRVTDIARLYLILKSIAHAYSTVDIPEDGHQLLFVTPKKPTRLTSLTQQTGTDNGTGGPVDGNKKDNGKEKGKGTGNGNGDQGKQHKSNNPSPAEQLGIITKYSLKPVYGETNVWSGTHNHEGVSIPVTAVAKKMSNRDSKLPIEVELLQLLAQTEYAYLFPRLFAWEYSGARDKYFIVLETGITIRDYIRSNVHTVQRYPQQRLAALLPLFVDVAEAVYCLHKQGYWHRDIKPANIIVNMSTKRPQLIDFNISRRQSNVNSLSETYNRNSSSRVSTTKPIDAATASPVDSKSDMEKQAQKTMSKLVRPSGTVGYIPPELYTSGASYTAACDVYSLGITLLCLFLEASTGDFKYSVCETDEEHRQRQFAFIVRQGLLDCLNKRLGVQSTAWNSMIVDPVFKTLELMVSTDALERPSMEAVIATFKSQPEDFGHVQ